MVMGAFSGLFPQLYNTTDAIRQLGGDLIRIIAVLMPVNAYVLACYFTLRSGGQALVTLQRALPTVSSSVLPSGTGMV